MHLIEAGLRLRVERYLGVQREVPENLRSAISYSLLAGGKRIRPRVTLAVADLLGLDREAGLSAGLAVEMIHCFTLIHDDLPCMDNDDFRRGQPSNHRIHGEALALLAGDALIPMAFETLMEARAVVASDRLLFALQMLLRNVGATGVLGGQAMEFLIQKDSSIGDLRRMHQLKTGALFEASVLCPAYLSGIQENSEDERVLKEFSRVLGVGFQLADDLEDRDQEAQAPKNIINQLGSSGWESVCREMTEDFLRVTRLMRERWGNAFDPLAVILNQVHQRFNRGVTL